MKIAVISDIHGNLAALQAVLADIEHKGPDYVCCAGDLVGYGPFPNEVINVIRENKIPSVLGNYDDAIGNRRIVCGCDYKDDESAAIGSASIQWTSEQITEENRAFLKDLPFGIDLGTENCGVRVVHGSPRRLNEYLHQELEEKVLNELLVECTAGVIVCGHTHVPYFKHIGGKLLVNAGSVGKPRHGDPRASYSVVEINGTARAKIYYVEYDVESTAGAIIEKGLPEVLAQKIRTGRD
ncbi:MAG: YfcE family phosphodiesterase [Firmicutes bacterium HGW-Firmicutes-14]|nr:MAG: YfcE family phosphodiesterase [Firmicutes bacterium HGW-Firmicutes-14]